jgi:hypothetical protein
MLLAGGKLPVVNNPVRFVMSKLLRPGRLGSAVDPGSGKCRTPIAAVDGGRDRNPGITPLTGSCGW